MQNDLKVIKKKYGEEMMHLCRDLFPTILEKEGKLSRLLIEHFEPTHELYNDLNKENLFNDFKNYVYSLIGEATVAYKTEKTPEELMDEAGYVLYECKSEEDIQNFRKYYAHHEELCTFRGERLDSCCVFFAVKKNVDNIKREDYPNPERQDEYGTSVISIQFSKNGDNNLSIKNRYNHTVVNPDATFSNNLENIIPGLTYSFEKYYGIVQKHKNDNFEIANYVKIGRKYYKYNCEYDNIYFCPNNVVINYKIERYPKEKVLIFEYFILDLQAKTIKIYDQVLNDSFVDGLQDIKDIKIENNSNGKTIYITPNVGEVIEINLNKCNRIIGYKNNNLSHIGENFLWGNETLEHIECNNVQIIDGYFLCHNTKLLEISLPNTVSIGNSFLWANTSIKKVSLPKVKKIGSSFLYCNLSLEDINISNVEEIDSIFLYRNIVLKKLNCPLLQYINSDFLFSNECLEEINIPLVKIIGDYFLCKNIYLKKIDCPNLEIIGTQFLANNQVLEEINFPNVLEISNHFMGFNNSLIKLYLPEVTKIGCLFLAENNTLKEFYAPKLKELELDNLQKNKFLEKYENGCLKEHSTIKLNETVTNNTRVLSKYDGE